MDTYNDPFPPSLPTIESPGNMKAHAARDADENDLDGHHGFFDLALPFDSDTSVTSPDTLDTSQGLSGSPFPSTLTQATNYPGSALEEGSHHEWLESGDNWIHSPRSSLLDSSSDSSAQIQFNHSSNSSHSGIHGGDAVMVDTTQGNNTSCTKFRSLYQSSSCPQERCLAEKSSHDYTCRSVNPGNIIMPTSAITASDYTQVSFSRPILTIHPTPPKSRVETQIPIKLTLFPMPEGITKLHLPKHTISKPKLISRPTPSRSADMLELRASLVCTSAMQDRAKREQAFNREAGSSVNSKPKLNGSRTSSSGNAEPFDDAQVTKPLDGGPVNICANCILRERKRANRKKTKNQEEEDLWQRDEAKRIIVFNTHELKDWQEPTVAHALPNDMNAAYAKPGSSRDRNQTMIPPGAMQIDLPMRIACYCRHQDEKLGFQ